MLWFLFLEVFCCCYCFVNVGGEKFSKYHIQPNYCTYPYKRTVKQFQSLQIIASVLYVYFFIKAYVVDTHLNCVDKSMQFKWAPTIYAFIKKITKIKNTKSRSLILFKCNLSIGRYIFYQMFS